MSDLTDNFYEAEEYLDSHPEDLDAFLMHYGIKRRSGRYPWGSGEAPYQRTPDLLSRIEEYKKQGLSEKEIAAELKLTTTQLRIQKSIAINERRALLADRAEALRNKGYTLDQIAKEMGYSNDSSIRSLLNERTRARMNVAQETADFLKRQIEEKGMINVGAGAETALGNLSRGQLDQALYMLQLEGYPVYGVGVPQATNPGQQTNIKVLCPKDTPHSEAYNFDEIHSIQDYVTYDNGQTFRKAFEYPTNMDISRLKINYAEDGGTEKDGLIELRRGVDDLSLGDAHYAQVRIRVDGDRYLKGMAVYSDDLPEGVDVIFNTNKSKDVPPRDVLKPIKNDPNNPFGSLIKEHGGQSYYIGEDGKEHLSLINKRAEEEDWGEWGKKLPSQFLSKQNFDLMRKQLNLSIADYEAELDEIMKLENPTIKKYMLDDYAQNVDKASVQLKAASLPDTRYQVIIPVPSMKDDEVFAPNYKDGERVALIRYPHSGTFEIPICKVNNKQEEAVRVITREAKDAVGINANVAARLSGADFDGDTVMVIPLRRGIKITSTPPLDGLKGFDPKLEYGGKPEGTFKPMTAGAVQNEMGKISNLITDMTLRGATFDDDELAKAVRHSMVVIDAYKHKLDYKQSEKDNNIAYLKEKYQGGGGASTLISRAKSERRISKRSGNPWVDPDTGELLWERINPITGEKESKIHPEYYTDRKTGKTKERTIKSTAMAETKDAFTLSSGTKQETYYAEYANKLKALANKARKESYWTKDMKYNPSAKKAYATEVTSLLSQLKICIANKPKEQQAQIMTNAIMKKKRAADPDLTPKEIKKLNQTVLTEMRQKVGAKRNPIKITEKQWQAIQAGAISANILKQIIQFSDKTELKKLATPRTQRGLSQFQVNRAKAMRISGFTMSEIAEALGKSVSTINKYLKGGD